MLTRIERLIDDFEGGRLSRRELVAGLLGLAAVGATLRASTQSAAEPTFQATDINHLALRVTDVSRSRAFYEKHLGLTLRSDDAPQSVFMNVGRHDFLALFKADEPAMDHYCYTINGYDPGGAVKRLEAAGLEPRRRGNRVYFDDPDGLEVQVSAPNRVRD